MERNVLFQLDSVSGENIPAEIRRYWPKTNGKVFKSAVRLSMFGASTDNSKICDWKSNKLKMLRFLLKDS